MAPVEEGLVEPPLPLPEEGTEGGREAEAEDPEFPADDAELPALEPPVVLKVGGATAVEGSTSAPVP